MVKARPEFSLLWVCPTRSRGTTRARLSFCSTTFCSLYQNGSHGQEQSHNNTTHDTAVLLTMSEAESGIRRRPCRDVWVLKPYIECSSRFPKRDENVDHGPRFIRESEREKGSNQIISRDSMGSNLIHDHFHQIPSVHQIKMVRHLLV